MILLTRSAQPADYSASHQLGAVVCMAKPFQPERLQHVVRLVAPPPTLKSVYGASRSGVTAASNARCKFGFFRTERQVKGAPARTPLFLWCADEIVSGGSPLPSNRAGRSMLRPYEGITSAIRA